MKKSKYLFVLGLVFVLVVGQATPLLAHDDEPDISVNLGTEFRFGKSRTNGTASVSSSTSSPKPRELKRVEVKERLQEKTETFRDSRVHLENVKVTAKTSTSLTVDNAGTSVTVNVTEKTQLRRKFWGKSDLNEFSVGNTVNVIGKWTDDTKTALNAVMIRNESIQKRYGTFFGTVKSLTAGGFTMTTIQREDQTVTIGTAKLINRKEETITSTDLKVGDRIRVKGLWDKSLKTVTEVKEIKNFSLPPLPSRSPKPSSSPTATQTPSPTPSST